jgi:hypothetical protein
MKRAVSFAAVAVVLAGLAGACAQTSSADATTKHLAIVGQDAKATTMEMVDLGKPGFSPGDELIEENPATDASGANVAKLYTIVTMTSGKSMADATGIIDCHVVWKDGSTVLFNGSVDMKKLGGAGVSLPVIGGTGAYNGAGGTVHMQAPDQKTTNISFDLLIPTVAK